VPCRASGVAQRREILALPSPPSRTDALAVVHAAEAVSAATVAPTLVPFESSYQVTPSISAMLFDAVRQTS
jgi:hypothetical protein